MGLKSLRFAFTQHVPVGAGAWTGAELEDDDPPRLAENRVIEPLVEQDDIAGFGLDGATGDPEAVDPEGAGIAAQVSVLEGAPDAPVGTGDDPQRAGILRLRIKVSMTLVRV